MTLSGRGGAHPRPFRGTVEAEHVVETLGNSPELVVTGATTREGTATTYRGFGSFDGREIGGRRRRGRSPRERHRDGEVLLMPLEGSYETRLLAVDGQERAEVAPGSLQVVPRGVSH